MSWDRRSQSGPFTGPLGFFRETAVAVGAAAPPAAEQDANDSRTFGHACQTLSRGWHRSETPRGRACGAPPPNLLAQGPPFVVAAGGTIFEHPANGRRRQPYMCIEVEWRRLRRADFPLARTHTARALTLSPATSAVYRAFFIRSARPSPHPPTPNHGGCVRVSRCALLGPSRARAREVVLHRRSLPRAALFGLHVTVGVGW